MRIISFAWTTEALIQGKKTVTRRMWKKRLVRKDDMVQAYDKAPYHKGKCIAIIEIMSARHEPLYRVTDEEERKEGGLWGSGEQFIQSFLKAYPGMKRSDNVWRIEFVIVKSGGKRD